MVTGAMRVRVMTNPAQLLLAGNPGTKRKASKAGKAWAKKMAAAKAAKAAASTPSKERPMAKRRKKKSKASREKRVLRRRARRSSRRAKRVASSPKPARRRRRSRKASFKRRSRKVRAARTVHRKARRSRRRARARKTRTVSVAKGHAVVIRKRRGSRGKLRVSRRRGRRGVKVGVNAGSLTLAGGLTHFLANAKATMHDGVKGFAFALAGAGVSVAGGAFTSQVTANIVGRFAPQLLSNPIVSRLLGAVNYYLPGWAAAKYIPGLSGKSRRAMLTGAAAAAIVEVIRPGMVRQGLSQLPVVGGLLSGVENQASDLGAYVGYALNGAGDGSGYAGAYDNNPGAGSGEQASGMPSSPGVGDYYALSDYVALGEYAPVSSDAVSNILH